MTTVSFSDSSKPLLDVLLDKADLPPLAALAFGRLLARPMVRPAEELATFLARYPEFAGHDPAIAVEILRAKGYLIGEKSDRDKILTLAPTALADIAISSGISMTELEELVDTARNATPFWHFNDLGKVTGNSTQFTSWIAAIDRARFEILVWVMNSYYPAVAEAIARAADRGVSVRLLVGGKHSVGRLRGGFEGRKAAEAARRWSALQRRSKVDVRAVRQLSDLEGAGSTLVDRQMLRYTIYDSKREYGSDGVMVELVATHRLHSLNLVRAYETMFVAAWRRSSWVPSRSAPWFVWTRRLLRRVAAYLPFIYVVGLLLLAGGEYGLQAGYPAAQRRPIWVDITEGVVPSLIAALLVLMVQRIIAWQRDREIVDE